MYRNGFKDRLIPDPEPEEPISLLNEYNFTPEMLCELDMFRLIAVHGSRAWNYLPIFLGGKTVMFNDIFVKRARASGILTTAFKRKGQYLMLMAKHTL